MASETSMCRDGQLALPRPVVWLLGLPFDSLTIEELAQRVRQAAARRERLFLSTVNVNFAVLAHRDAQFRRSVLVSHVSVPDGAPLVWLARWLGLPLRERVAGADLFERLRSPATPRLKVYFFGGAPGVAERASRVLNAEDGGLECVGFQSPGFGSVDELSSPESIAQINAARPDFLVVSLGAQKGQAWIVRNLPELDVPVVSHLGAVVNFVAGAVRRAPRWMQRSGLEWAWRIAAEPRLAYRYAGDGIRLLPLALSELARNRRDRHGH